ncbi:MAG: group 1 truncated hemoglobin [Alphaproteobacteria bacterium]|nr:group 1 truncated hemoglobin [Alphaproteobacteria bacterium]
MRAIVDAFVARVHADFVVGFLFEGRDLARIAQHELELASGHLGGPLRYAGRPLGQVHRPLRINGGQFRRRMAILARVLEERGVPEETAARWLAHDRKLERVVTDGTDCVGSPVSS